MGKKMNYSNLKINDYFVVNALRNCGYTNYSALADIIDNSIETEVESTFVKVDFECSGTGNEKKINSILIIDDGNGMDMETLKEAMNLGSETGKNGSINLGMYGAGLKTAAFSIGQKLEVFSKTANDKNLNYACISLEDAISNEDGKIMVGHESFKCDSQEFMNFFATVGKENGTIVKISHLDKLSTKNFYTFKDTLKNKIGEIYNKYIYSDVVKFYVCKDLVPYIDLMGNSKELDLMGEGNFQIDGHEIKYKCWYIPSVGCDENEGYIKKPDETEYITSAPNNQGFYIYRQNRLVGKAITLGIWVKHPTFRRFRCELFIDGTCDYLFGSTFTKMINESAKDTLSQALSDKLKNEIKPFVNESKRRADKEAAERKLTNIDEIKANEEFYERVTKKQNSNIMLRANRKGENKPRVGEKQEHEKRGPQKNPNPTKKRENKWLDGFEEKPLGANDEMYIISPGKGGTPRIIINTDHQFYKKFYSQLNNDLKFIAAQIISCKEIAKTNVNYYLNDEIQCVIDNYDSFQSSEVSKSLMF